MNEKSYRKKSQSSCSILTGLESVTIRTPWHPTKRSKFVIHGRSVTREDLLRVDSTGVLSELGAGRSYVVLMVRVCCAAGFEAPDSVL